jgi:hypothetical protein
MTARTIPIYARIWQQIRQFPKGLAAGSNDAPATSGPAAAALISSSIGAFTMMVTHHLSDADTSKATEKFVHSLGFWIPGSANPNPIEGNIGSYTGKETMLLVGWVVSWVILYLLLRNTQVRPRTIFFCTFVLLVASIAMCWHPLFPYLPLQ